MSRPATLGDLRASGWESRPVKEEVRANAITRVAAGESPVLGVLGFEDTVIPQLENALLAGHDVIFLGERGQAKTRMIRSLMALTSVTGRGYETGVAGVGSACRTGPGAGRVSGILGYSADMSRPATLGDLRASGWESRAV
ncbi:MAG: hypothetical protein ACXVL8_19620, partial [Acidimicrobiia bacterium]